jgi:hypothetical protein
MKACPAMMTAAVRSRIYARVRLLSVERRVSSRAALAVARQRIHAGMVHAGALSPPKPADTMLRVYDGEELLTEVARITTRPIARFKVRKPEPPRRPTHPFAARDTSAPSGLSVPSGCATSIM